MGGIMKNKMTKPDKNLLRSYQKGEWKSKGKKTRKAYIALAKKQIKEERINIRLPEETLSRIREEALNIGLPYQTLIASILYRYAHERLHDEGTLRRALKLFKE